MPVTDPQLGELEERRHELRQQMQEILTQAEGEDRDLTAEEEQEFDRRQEEYDNLERRKQRLDAVRKMLGADGDQARRLITSEPAKWGEGDGDVVIPEWLPEQIRSNVERAKREGRGAPTSFREFNALRFASRPQDDEEYRWAFFRYMTVRDKAELSAAELRVLSKATAAAGANLVPTEFQRELIQALREFGVVRDIARVLTTDAGESLQWPSVTSHGTAAWVAENAAYTESDEAFGQFSLSAHKGGTIMKVSEELLTDSAFDLDSYIRDEFGQRLGVLQNTAYTVGSGSGQPAGWNNNATVGVTAATGNTTTIPADNLFDLVHSVAGPYRRNGVFVMSDAAVKTLRKLKDTTNQYLWSPGLQAGVPDTILSYPVYTDPDVPVPAASARSIGFGDFGRGYVIRDVNGVAFQRLNELYAANGQIGFRAYHRTEGKIANAAAIRVFVHSAT